MSGACCELFALQMGAPAGFERTRHQIADVLAQAGVGLDARHGLSQHRRQAPTVLDFVDVFWQRAVFCGHDGGFGRLLCFLSVGRGKMRRLDGTFTANITTAVVFFNILR